MSPVDVEVEGIRAEVQGGWVAPLPDDAREDDLQPVRLDDGRTGGCHRDEGFVEGDRVYRTVYRGPLVKERVGVDFHNASSGATQIRSGPAVRHTSRVYLMMAIVPVMVLAVLAAAAASGVRHAALIVAMAAISSGLVLPAALNLKDALHARQHNRAARTALARCRAEAATAIASDVHSWRMRLEGAAPADAGVDGCMVIRGVLCRMVTGLTSDACDAIVTVGTGMRIPMPVEGVETCLLMPGDTVHALIPAGRVPPVPIAVCGFRTALCWMDGSVVGGADGTVYRKTIRETLGRATWRLVTRQIDEIGRRRRARHAA